MSKMCQIDEVARLEIEAALSRIREAYFILEATDRMGLRTDENREWLNRRNKWLGWPPEEERPPINERNKMKIHGLIGRIGHDDHGGGHLPWLSRDYPDIDCQAVGCLFNRGKKCMTPSACEIGDDGRCKGFTAPPPPKKIDGD